MPALRTIHAMTTPERYASCDGDCIDQADNGDYVKFTDYETLLIEAQARDFLNSKTIKTLVEELQRMHARLKEFGTHKYNCDPDDESQCHCGWSKLARELRL